MTSAHFPISLSLTFPLLHSLRYAVIIRTFPTGVFLQCPSTATSKRLCSTGSSSAAIQTLTHGRIACISRPARRRERAAWVVCTKRFGNRRMGRSLQGTRFTTATETPWTIRWITWRACRPDIINGTTGPACQRSSDRQSGSGSSGSGRWPRRGIARKMGGAGIGSWAAGRGKDGRAASTSASNAGRAIAHGRSTAPIVSARTDAGRRRAETMGLITLFAIANGVGRSSPSTDTPRSAIAHDPALLDIGESRRVKNRDKADRRGGVGRHLPLVTGKSTLWRSNGH